MMPFNSYYQAAGVTMPSSNGGGGGGRNHHRHNGGGGGHHHNNGEMSLEQQQHLLSKEINFEPSKTLFLGDLSYFCTEEELFSLFATYGSITSIKVQRGVSGEPLLHGYIVFHSPLSARQALLEVDGIAFMGRNIR
jgi:RNA recognition motif-containing protein